MRGTFNFFLISYRLWEIILFGNTENFIRLFLCYRSTKSGLTSALRKLITKCLVLVQTFFVRLGTITIYTSLDRSAANAFTTNCKFGEYLFKPSWDGLTLGDPSLLKEKAQKQLLAKLQICSNL